MSGRDADVFGQPSLTHLDHSPPWIFAAHTGRLDGLQLKIAKSRKRTFTDYEIVKICTAAEEQAYPHGTVVLLLLLTG